MQDSELKPCPFCGGAVQIVTPHVTDMSPYISHLDKNCPVDFSEFHCDGDLATAWNTRPQDSGKHNELVERLETSADNMWLQGHHAWATLLREATSALSRHDGGRTEALEEALREVDGCFEAAYVEGLSERLSELDTGVGGIRDLIERRLLPARAAAIRALQSHPHSTDDKWMKTQDSGKHNELVERLKRAAKYYAHGDQRDRNNAAMLTEAASALARHAGGRNAGLEEAAMVGEIAVAVVKKSIADWCQSQIVPSHQGGGIAIESANRAYERVIGLLTAPRPAIPPPEGGVGDGAEGADA